MTYEEKFDVALAHLSNGMQRHPSIKLRFQKQLLEVIKEHPDDVKVIGKKFQFNIALFESFVKDLGLDLRANKKDRENKEAYYYKAFRRLKKFLLIHPQSASNFVMSLSLVSINPNPMSLLIENFNAIDLFKRRVVSLSNKIENEPVEKNIEKLYIYLRLFHIYPLSSKVLANLKLQDIVTMSGDKVALIVYEDTFIGKTEQREAQPYKTIFLDELASTAINGLKKLMRSDDDHLFVEASSFEKAMNIYKKDELKNNSIASIKSLNRNYHLFKTNLLNMTIKSKIISTVGCSLAEIEAKYPGSVSKRLMEFEAIKIKAALSRPRHLDEDEAEEDGGDGPGISIYDLEALLVILRYKKNKVPKKLTLAAISEVENFQKFDDTMHSQMVYGYLLYLLNLLLAKRLRSSTVKGYVFTLNKHLFQMVENLDSIQHYEIMGITKRLEDREYKGSSIQNIKAQMARFFRYYNKKGIRIDIAAAYYPKSMIFDFEVDKILATIENEHILKAGLAKVGPNQKHSIRQKQMLVLLTFYTGPRKKEIHSLLLREISIHDDLLTVHVSKKGLKSAGYDTKTASAKRRVSIRITNIKHLNLIKSFLEKREEMNKGYKFLSLAQNKKGMFIGKLLEEKVFDELNYIIKVVTKRYCTFHSLRHSFISYNINKLLSKGTKYPYEFMEISVMAGHQVPEITIPSYTHIGVI